MKEIAAYTKNYFFLILQQLVVTMATSETTVNSNHGDTCYCVEEVVSGLRSPLSASFFIEDHQERFVVVEQMGVASVYSRDGRRLRTLIDISDRINLSNEVGESRGLLSLVLDPRFNQTGRLYVYYISAVDRKEYSYISEFQTRGGVVDLASEKMLLRIYQPYRHGNGGPMLYGDDGHLYIFVGDGSGLKDDPIGYAQLPTSLRGKVLRITVSGGQDFVSNASSAAKSYATPSDNPYKQDRDKLDEIYALGVRNMWGCSQDSVKLGGTGKIICAETGTDYFDEINVIEKGKNYGWPLKEGNACLDPVICPAFENPGTMIYQFAHDTSHALVGGYVYRGKHLVDMADRGLYTFGDVIHGNAYFLEETPTGSWRAYNWSQCSLHLCPKDSGQAVPLTHLLAWAQDLEGELYLMMTRDLVATKASGKLFKMVPPSSAARRHTMDWLVAVSVGLFAPLILLLDWHILCNLQLPLVCLYIYFLS